jgi:DNA-binding sugar fermentation-stimulating protein
MHFSNCQYGFEWGAAKITRLFSDEKKGWITVEVKTPKEELQIYVTKTGKIRIHGASEWLPQKDNKESRTQHTTNQVRRKAKS